VETLDFVGNDRLVAFTHGRGAFVTTLGGATGRGGGNGGDHPGSVTVFGAVSRKP